MALERHRPTQGLGDEGKSARVISGLSGNAANPANAWNVNFDYGNDNNDDKTNDNVVRLVRGGE
jgi:hypothetical protein